MGRRNLHELPRFKDGWSFLYVEKGIVEREKHGLRLVRKGGDVLIPAASLSALMLGPGTTITQAAVTIAGDCGCSLVWCGENAVRFYASGSGDDRRCDNLYHQARLWADHDEHMKVVRRMYTMRFNEHLDDALTLEQIRGHEGVRVREAYAQLSRETGITWHGRAYKRGDWASADPVNRALSAANACLHALTHSAIKLSGYSEDLGFVHTGKSRAFVYDIADLYKVELTLPLAFREAAVGTADLETRVRKACRSEFFSSKLLERIIPDIQRTLGQKPIKARVFAAQDFEASSLGLWDPEKGETIGGVNHATDAGDVEPPEDLPS